MATGIINNFTDEEFSEIVKKSSSIREVCHNLGYASDSGSNPITVKRRIEKLNLDISHFSQTKPQKRTKENIFIEQSSASQATLRRWYKKGEYSPYECSICGLGPMWQEKELTLILDHINGNSKDDRLENLRWVCPNCNQQLETTGFKTMRTKNESKECQEMIKEPNHCIDCGKVICDRANRCVNCANKYRGQQKESRISKEELKEKIRFLPFTKIGEEYGISDNAVRKWCDKYNLPRTKKEINKYSDEEWEKI